MKRKIVNALFAACLTASLAVGSLPTAGLAVKAAADISQTVESGLTIKESEINQLLTGDLILPDSVDGLDGAAITYSVGNADAKYVAIEGNTLKVTRPYAGESDYKFTLTATVTAEGATYTKNFPLTVRAGLSDDSYAGYVYVCFGDVENPNLGNNGSTDKYVDVQQVHFFLSEDGLNWTALNGFQPLFLTGSDYIDQVEKAGERSLNYYVKDGTDVTQTTTGDASVLFPFEGEDQGIRDPYLIRGCRKDGSDSNKVWLLATDLNTMCAKYGPAANFENNIVGNWGTMSHDGSTNLFIYETEDWVHWTRRYIDVGGDIDAGMAWAPEAIYNPEKDNYLVYWSARVGADDYARNRLYCNETTDFIHFGDTKLYEEEDFYTKYAGIGGANDNDGYGNIDTSQLWVAEKDENGNVTNPYGTLFRLVKDETRTNNGKCLINIQLMGAKSVLDPTVNYDETNPTRINSYTLDGKEYSSLSDLSSLSSDKNGMKKAEIIYNWFRPESTGNHFEKIDQSVLDNWIGWHEGATMFKFIDRDEWCIMGDNYGDMSVRYEPFTTTDLSKPDSIVKLTSGYGRTGGDIGCHGGMIPITVKEYNTLIDTYNDKSKMTGMNEAALSNYHEISYISVDKRALDDKTEELKAAAKNNAYSAGVKAQMTNLAAQAEALSAKADATSAEIDKIIARADKLIANKQMVVPEVEAENVILSADSLTLCTKNSDGLKKTATLKASVNPDAASQEITWSSNKSAVASVNGKGVVTAKKAGTAKITATAANGKKATCTVTVKGIPNKITLNKTKATLKKGKTLQLSVKLPKGTVCSKFNYKSNKPKIAKVSPKGKITAKKKGTAKITVTAGNNKKAKATITVKVKE